MSNKNQSIRKESTDENDGFANYKTHDDQNEDQSDVDDAEDIFLLLNAEQDLIKFLHWAMNQLQPLEEYNRSLVNDSMFQWKNSNLSWRREPMYVQEPRYIIAPAESKKDDYSPYGK